MLKLCKARSRDRARDLRQAKKYISVLENAYLNRPERKYVDTYVILQNLLFTIHFLSVK